MNEKIDGIIFSHAGHDFILSDLKYNGKGHQSNIYTAFLHYNLTNVKIKISRWDNSRYDYERKINIEYKCIRINILKILKGEIDEDLAGFIKFLEYCFDFEIIDIIEGKLTWRLKK